LARASRLRRDALAKSAAVELARVRHDRIGNAREIERVDGGCASCRHHAEALRRQPPDGTPAVAHCLLSDGAGVHHRNIASVQP
jgi:hypothetical protein